MRKQQPDNMTNGFANINENNIRIEIVSMQRICEQTDKQHTSCSSKCAYDVQSRFRILEFRKTTNDFVRYVCVTGTF